MEGDEMDPQSTFYVERPSDQIALEAIGRQGVTITIKGARQMGKSSLLVRTMDAAVEADKRIASWPAIPMHRYGWCG
ncbi:MAG: AAA-like domain-containing protein [Candidatus Tectomicrobia bacterium]|uniref:AAA-like domain-containing protein n=1 Tax=Tectimicrobiota bacterium TaxID=2528274 RepID=A0A932G0Q9_UNCTE|nr:AAA-like domain-containing protein [Candidatus Tectomicrobia bacterium]